VYVKTQRTNLLFAGLCWPLEAIPIKLRYFSYTTPFSLPGIALRNVVVKGYSIGHSSILIGLSVSLGWCILSLVLGLFVLQKKKFSKNT